MLKWLAVCAALCAGETCPKAPFRPSGEVGTFTLSPLPYDFAALEPVLWSQIVFIHYEKHEGSFFDFFQAALPKNALTSAKRVEELAREVGEGRSTYTALMSYYSHYLYWVGMSPANCSHALQGELLQALTSQWGGLEAFQANFTQAALDLYGAGWVYLCASKVGLTIKAFAEDDGWSDCAPLLALDVWEHSYYLQYLSSRSEYVQNWWSLVDWPLLETLYTQYIARGEWVPV